MAEETRRVVAVAPELAAVTDAAQRAGRAAFLLDQADALRDRLSRQRGIEDEALANLLAAEASVRRAILASDQLVRQRISLLARRDAQLEAGLEAAVELTEIADTLVANAEMGASAVISSLCAMDRNFPSWGPCLRGRAAAEPHRRCGVRGRPAIPARRS